LSPLAEAFSLGGSGCSPFTPKSAVCGGFALSTPGSVKEEMIEKARAGENIGTKDIKEALNNGLRNRLWLWLRFFRYFGFYGG
jgi:hypothetical protein